MTPSVTVFGSANVDHIVAVPRIPLPGETVPGGHPSSLPGGKGLNQAIAAALSTGHPGAQSGPHREAIDAGNLTSEIINRPPLERTPAHLR